MLFISHSTTDDAHVNELADALQKAGFATWVDHRSGIEPGTPSWDKAIREAIKLSSAGVFVMSPRSLASDICGAECLLVRELGKPLYVLLLEKCDPADVWLYIKQIQYADLSTDFDAGMRALIDALGGKLGHGLPVPLRGRITGTDTMRRHLPYLQNPLRGRDTDIELVRSEIGACVLQIVGPGGLGKSRLCAEIALSHPTGAVWHRCASITTHADLLDDLRQHTRLPDTASQAEVLAALTDAPPLVVIDNAEEVTQERRTGYTDLLTALIGRGVPVLLTTRSVWRELKPRRDHTPHALSQTVGAQIALDFAASERILLTEEQAGQIAQKARLHPRLIEFAVGQLHERRFDRIIRQLDELTHEDIREALDEMIVKTVRQMVEQAPYGPQAESLLRRLTILQGTFALAAAQALAPDPSGDPEDALETLQRWQFVRYDRQADRYALAPLLREALGVPDAPDLFAAYARFFTDRAEAVFTLPPQDWAAHEADQPDITALGDELAIRFAAGTLSPDLHGQALAFAVAVYSYCHYRPQAVHTAAGVRLRGMNWLEMGLGLARHQQDQRRQALFLSQLGLAWSAVGEKQKALVHYEQALPLIRVVGDWQGEAVTLNNLGKVWSALGEQQKALDYYGQALPLYRAVGDRGGEATTLNNIGKVWADLGEKQKALDYYEQALPLHRAVRNRGGEATTLNNLGWVWDDLGEKQKALEYYEQALSLDRAIGNRRGEATMLNNLGGVWDDLGEKQKALEYYEQALPLRRAVGDRGGEATTLHNIGRVWNDLGEKQKALECYGQALPLHRAVGNRGGEATTLHNIGRVWDDLGEKQKALDYYEQALPLHRAVGNRGVEATTLTNLGGVWDSLGEKRKALDYYEQALPLHRAVGNRGGEATTLNNIALTQAELARYTDALTALTQAVELYPDNTLYRYWAGLVRLCLGQWAAAIEDLYASADPDAISQAYAALWLSITYTLSGDSASAQAQAAQMAVHLPVITPQDAQNRVAALWTLYTGDLETARRLYAAVAAEHLQTKNNIFNPRFYLQVLAACFPQRQDITEVRSEFLAQLRGDGG